MQAERFGQLLRGTEGEKMDVVNARDYATEVIESTKTQDEEWAKFCLFPDILPPQRMPSMFPIPSHIYKERDIFSISSTVGTGIRCVWQPEHYRGFSRFCYQVTDSPLTDNIDPANTGVTIRPMGQQDRSSVAHGGVRLIGAYVEIDYMGTVEDSRGIIEVGLHINSHKLGLTSGVSPVTDVTDVHFATDGEMQQLPYYQKFHSTHGTRVIWFPIDGTKFEYAPHFSTDELSQADNVDQNVPHTQDKVRLEWCINIINPVAGDNNYRVTMVNIYESIPDENESDLYCPIRPKYSGDPDNAMRGVHKIVQHTAGASTSKTSKASFFHAVKQKLADYAPHIVGYGLQGAGLYFQNPNLFNAGTGVKMLTQGESNVKSYRI